MTAPPPILIMGPTASGKSALALALAERLNGAIVNADSMQVYADLHVLTARPSAAETARAPHRLYGFVDAAERYSVGRWLADARLALTEIEAAGRRAIVVGGTGLYFKALTEGLIDAPAAPPEVRARLAAALAEQGAPALHARLAGRDPAAAARLGQNDAPRILRALEVAETLGAPLSSITRHVESPVGRFIGVLLKPDRAALYAAIDARFEAMLAQGALDEVRALADRRLDPALPCMKAHGAPWLLAHLRGEMTLQAAADLARRDTRRYAKRQFTWMAGQMPDWTTVEGENIAQRADFVERLCARSPS